MYPCVRGIGLPALRLGSLRQESPLTIMQRTLANKALRRLRDEGPYYLFEAVKKSQAGNLLYPGYVDACHFHHHVLTTPELTEIASNTDSNLDFQMKTLPGQEGSLEPLV